ncbi:type VII secretion system-associated protein [Streptomyces sp. NBC_00102]|uniref:type VII secretion system-associated protein n=1 Tax=Streptomyces sp. NBC_00102 TaxID=2975652 RepID=UPI0022569563|nr:type VII secretion system-associated protein [Streptomyces sp. NBC_00102]MCX5401150.1 type VII secretion system-associated protein [Streptomyces sp. NBC_00102]
MADLTHLNGQKLKQFRDHDLATFITDLKGIVKDDPNGVLALHSIVRGTTPAQYIGENPVLGIGLMTADDTVYGKTLIDVALKSAKSIDDVLGDQGVLFGDIDDSLDTTITTLLNTQGASLESINGEKFLDVWSGVDEDLEGPDTDD